MAATATKEEEWVGKQTAAKFLKVSFRQLERRAQAGYIAKKFLPRKPSEKAQAVVYKMEDLRALKDGTPNMSAVVMEAPRPPKPKKAAAEPEAAPQSLAVTRSAEADPFEGLAAKLVALSTFAAKYQPKPWLTLAEAVEYSGLPAAFLLSRAHSKPVGFAVNVGQGTKAFWRFSREGLAKL